MTTDNIKAVIQKWHDKRKVWPSRAELIQALMAEGFAVDSVDLNDLLSILCAANELQVINGTLVI